MDLAEQQSGSLGNPLQQVYLTFIVFLGAIIRFQENNLQRDRDAKSEALQPYSAAPVDQEQHN